MLGYNYSATPIVLRRYGGARHYQKMRRIRAAYRRSQLARLRLEHPDWVQQRMAKELGCNQSTISRDYTRLAQDIYNHRFYEKAWPKFKKPAAREPR